MSASSNFDRYHSAKRGRLHICKSGRFRGAWSSRRNVRGQWLQVDLGSRAYIVATAIQGRQDFNQWVKSYTVKFSNDGIRFYSYRSGRSAVFRGNRDRNTVVRNTLAPAIKARYLRFYPVSWHGHISCRVELYGRYLKPRPVARPMGISNNRLNNRYITASSSWNRYHVAWLARLYNKKRGRYSGGWSAKVNRRGQWIQFDLRQPKTIVKVVTQGRADANQWVTRYFIKYSSDAFYWTPYKKYSRVQVFIGNRDRNTIKSNIFDPPIRARYVRIYPIAWVGHMSLRAEFYGIPLPRYSVEIGLEDGKIPSRAFSASSKWDNYHRANRARLNSVATKRYRGGWSARKNNRRQWIQIRLGRGTRITGVVTQGRQDANQWVTSYSLSYSLNGRTFRPYKENGRLKVFPGNRDRNTQVSHKLQRTIFTKYVRFHPITWFGHISMRIGLYGQRTGVRRGAPKPLGLQNGRIPNSAISASSQWDRNHAPWLARLKRPKRGRYAGSWSAKINNRQQWLQVNFRGPKKVVAVATQGRQDYNQWVTLYYLSFSVDGVYFARYVKNGRTKIFRGNRDRNTIVMHSLRPAIKARVIRLHPVRWVGHISCRVEFYGRRTVPSRLALGVEDRRIPDGGFSASSSWDRNHGPKRARLNIIRQGRLIGAWSSRANNRAQWLLIDITKMARVVGFAIQGRQDTNQWVLSLRISYSRDGIRFRYYTERRRPKLFRGNRDRNSAVKNFFKRSFVARFVQFHPFSWHGHISMRVELYGYLVARQPPVKPSGIPTGIRGKRYVTASSTWNRYHAPWRARLHQRVTGRYRGGWSARKNNRRQYIQFDLRRPYRVVKVVTQGRYDAKQWVTSFIISYSQDKYRWIRYKQYGKVKIFPGNKDRNTIKENLFVPPFRARYVRIHPWTWVGHISLRAEFYVSYISPNAVPIGVEDGKIPNGYVTSSSTYNRYHAPWLGRINNKARGRNKGGWSAKKNDKRQWLQFNLGRPTLITVIRTQGRQDASQWVTSYKMYFGNDGVRFTPYKKGGRVKIFRGNNDRNSIVSHPLRPPIRARFIRVVVVTWHRHISLRVGFYGRRPGIIRPRLQALGMQRGRIRNSQIAASSSWDRYHAAWRARLNHKRQARYRGAWSSRVNDRYQWLQVTFRRPKKIVAISTQGRQDANQWVTKYWLTYSMDRVHYVYYKQLGVTKVFRANRNRNSIVRHYLQPAVRALSIRVRPLSWFGHISMRLELYGRNAVTYRLPLGVEDRRIPDSALSSSSRWGAYHGPHRARLNTQRRGRHRGAWSSRANNRNQWLQIDIGTRALVYGIATQGRQDAGQWVKMYKVMYSRNGVRWRWYQVRRRTMVLTGNRDRNTIVRHRFARPLRARYIRVVPVLWHSHISMRVEIYGRRLAREPVARSLGISKGRFNKRYIRASSEWDRYHAAYLARLNLKPRGRYKGGWSAKKNNRRQWIQVDFRRPVRVSKIATQGRADANQYVTSFAVAYSPDGYRWTPFRANSRLKVFRGNRDHYSIKENTFDPPFRARFVRVYARTWVKHISMRLEFYGQRSSRRDLPLGIEDYKIRGSYLTASTEWNKYHGARFARLNSVARGRNKGAWSAKRNNRRQWIMVDLKRRTIVTRILTQGRQDANQWVTSYTLSYSNNGRTFRPYTKRRRVQIFPANNDRNSVVAHALRPRIYARYVKIKPNSWFRHISMRFELYGQRTAERVKPTRPTKRPGRHPPRPPIKPPIRPPIKPPVSIKHCPVTLDLAFVMDASSDVGRANFQLEKAFAKTVSGKFTITKHQSHIGLITYANLPSLRMRFRQYNSIFAVRRAINQAPYVNRGGKRLDLALQAAYDTFYRNEPTYIQRVLVVLTGGPPNRRYSYAIKRMASRFTRKGVQVYAIGVGRAYRGELRSIAYKNKHVYYTKTFGSLVARANQIAAAICREQSKEVDIHKRAELLRPLVQKEENETNKESV